MGKKSTSQQVGVKDVPVLIRVPPAFKEALEKYADEQRRSLSQQCLVMLEEFMKQQGLWSPKSEEKK
jgi:hypothetical protein